VSLSATTFINSVRVRVSFIRENRAKDQRMRRTACVLEEARKETQAHILYGGGETTAAAQYKERRRQKIFRPDPFTNRAQLF